MPAFRFSSVLMSVLCSNLMIILLTIIFSNNRVIIRIRLHTLFVCISVIFLRLLIPFEFPVSHNIYYPPALSLKVTELLCDRNGPFGIIYTIAHVLLLIWIIGFAWNILRYMTSCGKLYDLIQSHGKDVTDAKHIRPIMKMLSSLAAVRYPVKVYNSTFVTEPCILKLKGTYFIMLPSNITFSESELKTILIHEWMHAAGHDITLKEIIHLVSMLYWWNPFCRVLEDQTGNLLELQTDSRISKLELMKDTIYLEDLINIAGKLKGKKTFSAPVALRLSTGSGKLLKMRLDAILYKQNDASGFFSHGLIIIICSLFMLSYIYIFEPGTADPGMTKGTFTLTNENTFAVQNNNGTYDIYFENEYWETVDSLQYYPENMKVYREGEDLPCD